MRQEYLALLLVSSFLFCLANNFYERIVPTETIETGRQSALSPTSAMYMPKQLEIRACTVTLCPNTSCPETCTVTITPTNTITALATSAEPIGPYDAGDCGASYKANLDIVVWPNYNCDGSNSSEMQNLAYFASQWSQEGFRSFRLSRPVLKNESLFFAQFGEVQAYSSSVPAGATQQSVGWLCGQRVGGILPPTNWPWTPNDCWSIPGDGFAQCVSIQRSGICPNERNLPPASNFTTANSIPPPAVRRSAALAPAGTSAAAAAAAAAAETSSAQPQRRGEINTDSPTTEVASLEERQQGVCELPGTDIHCLLGKSSTVTWCNCVRVTTTDLIYGFATVTAQGASQ